MNFTTAFKEWACIVDSLGCGDQILIIRKGGIHENNGRFEPEHREFLLFPTYEHQKHADLNPLGHKHLNRMDPQGEPDPVSMCYGAVVERVYWVENRDQLKVIEPLQALCITALEKRFEYGDSTGFFGLVLRVFRGGECLLPRLPQYAGCKSWIPLGKSLTLTQPLPVLSDAAFNEKLRTIEEALKRRP